MSFTGPEFSQGEFPDDLVSRVKPELRPGECLLWAAAPMRTPPLSRGSIAWATGCVGLLYGISTLLLTIFFLELLGPNSPAVDEFAIFGTIFAVLAVLATIGWTIGGISSLTERRRAAREIYALTNQRALIWSPGETRGAMQFFSHDRGHFDRVHREERPDGSGDLHFSNSLGRYNPGPQRFREIADVKRVEALARQFVIHEIDEDDKHTTPDPSSIRRDIET